MDLEVLSDAGGVVVLDGGLATTLEAHGHDLTDALWSARLLLDDPAAIRAAHAAFLRAGARVVTTASYQLSAESLRAAGRDPAGAGTLLRRSVELAREAVQAHRQAGGAPAAVAASVGPYGAVLGGGAEYRGAYGLAAAALRDFHAPRLEALLDAGPDLLAVETIPSATEVEVLAELLRGSGRPAWVSVTPGADGATTAEGQPLTEALAAALDVEEVVAIGVNCCPPDRLEDALPLLAALGRPLIAYPNVGRVWDPVRGAWTVHARRPEPRSWVEAGARLVGGCCGTDPGDLAWLARRLHRNGPDGGPAG